MNSHGSRFTSPSHRSILDQPLWIDGPDAAQIVSTARVSEETRQAAMDLITKGFAIIRGAQDPATCRQVIDDYYRYSKENSGYVDASRDALGREKRMVNFHRYSKASLGLATNPRVMDTLDFLFGAKACVYTSLTFKYGTQQPTHRDTPHFATWPDGYFFGVWNALEDIAPESGPLFYWEGAHRYAVDPGAIWRDVQAKRPDLPQTDQLLLALDIYNGQVAERAPDHGTYRLAEMNCGDVAIWHPQTPHGGSPASDPMRSRWSTVFHCAPKDKQVHQHNSYFMSAGRDEPPARYAFSQANGRHIALAGEVAFQD
jgi:phytanoyl-CoA hydroxylase